MAGVLFQTSFDHYTTVTHRFNSVTGGSAVTIGAGVGRNSTSGLDFNNGSIGNLRAVRNLGGSYADLYCGFAIKVDVLPGVSRSIFELYDVSTIQNRLVLQTNGTLIVQRGDTTTLDTVPTFVMLPNVWYHIEVRVNTHSSTGIYTVKINEVQLLNLTSQDTAATANNYSTDFALASSQAAGQAAHTYFDDVVIRDDAFSGDVEVGAYLPTGIGVTNQWTPNTGTSATATDETAPNSDTDYIETSIVNDLTLLTYGTIPATSSIIAVIPMPFAKKTDAGTAKLKSVVRHSGVNYPGVEKAPSDGSYEYHPDVLMVNPGTGVAWTPSNWNAPVEIGPQRTA